MAIGVTHDIAIGGTEYRLTAGGYRRRPAPLRGARITTGDYGYSDLSIWQRWHQFCWNGGMGADKWVDDAMYYYGVGLDVTETERLTLSPDLKPSVNTDLRPNDLGKPRFFFTWQNPSGTTRLYCVSEQDDTDGSTLYKYQDWDDTWVVEQHWGDGKRARAYAKFAGNIVIGFNDGTFKYSDTPNVNGSWTSKAAPAGAGSFGIRSMMKYNGRMYVAYKDKVYRYKNDFTVDGSKVFYNPSGTSPMVAMEVHLGYLYMGSQSGHIHRTDGNNSFDIWQWDGGTEIKSLRSFDGRLFVGTYEYTDDRDVGHQGIYQFTGSAVTQLKKWGQGDKASIMGHFTEYDRKLFYGAPGLWGLNVDAIGNDVGGFGVAVFDPIEDAHSIWATNKDTGTYPDDAEGLGRPWVVDDVIFWNGFLFAAVRGFGNFRTKVKYRDTLPHDGEWDIVASGTNAGYLLSSNYDGGTPGLDKLWRDVVLTGDFPENTSATIHVSTDKGVTYTLIGTVNGDVGGGEKRVRFYLGNMRSHQLMYRLALDSTDATKSPVINGITVSYLPMPEPNWMWDISLTLTEKVVLLDRTTEVTDPKALEAQLAGWFRDQTLLDYIDMDGVSWPEGVILWDYNADYHVPSNAEDPEEWRVRLSLLEVQQGAP